MGHYYMIAILSIIIKKYIIILFLLENEGISTCKISEWKYRQTNIFFFFFIFLINYFLEGKQLLVRLGKYCARLV